MDHSDHSISWMISGGLRNDPAELRNQTHLRALRQAAVRPSLTSRVRALLGSSTPATPTPIDQVCCTA